MLILSFACLSEICWKWARRWRWIYWGSAYQVQTAAEIEARIIRLESGEEVLSASFFDEPKPIRKRASGKPRAAKNKGDSSKVDADAGLRAIQQANGDRQLGWSKYVIIKGLRPGCDAKDFYAFCKE